MAPIGTMLPKSHLPYIYITPHKNGTQYTQHNLLHELVLTVHMKFYITPQPIPTRHPLHLLRVHFFSTNPVRL